MSRILLVARREWLEQRRQPAMLASIGAMFTSIAALVIAALLLLDYTARHEELPRTLVTWAPDLGVEPQAAVTALAGTVVGIANWLVFTQLLGIAAVLAGHALLHDRQVGALPFLLLAPISRLELLAGKLLGALGAPLLLYFLLSGVASLVAAALPVTAPFADRLPPSPSFLIAFVLGGPAWAAAIGALCVIASSAARDVRTAQQLVWLLMFFATFVCGFLLAGLLPYGPAVQAGVAGLGAFSAFVGLAVGAQVIRRDLGR
jgi:ABC-type Na+ efflux pump permease subunit